MGRGVQSEWCSVAGMKGNGKSSLLLQAVEFARSNRWIIMYIPRGACPRLPLDSSSLTRRSIISRRSGQLNDTLHL